MEIPSWLKPGLWGVGIGAIGMAVVGFTQLGWTTAATANQLAADRSETAVVAALVPFCVAKSKLDPDQAVHAKFMAETSSYSRNDLVTQAGWATLPGMTAPNADLARACSDKLHGLKSG